MQSVLCVIKETTIQHGKEGGWKQKFKKEPKTYMAEFSFTS